MADTTDEPNPVGRPPKYTDEELEDIATDLEKYIRDNEDPTIVGFTSTYEKYSVNKSFMSERKEFSNLVKQAVDKQEAFITSGAIRNELNATFAIFRLKQPQHGWTDRSQVEQDTKVTHKYEELDDEQLAKLIQSRKDTVS